MEAMAVTSATAVKDALDVKTEDKKLNEDQFEAVLHGEGPLLIIAGAGTGKTTVITERIKHLILEENIKPSEVLALTFTEKAAREMEERIDRALPYGYIQMWIMTFHSFCDRILRREALHIGLNPQYKLATEAEIVQSVRKNLFRFDLDYFRPLGNPTKFIDGMLQHFSRLQDEDVSPVEYLAWVRTQKLQVKNQNSSDQDLELEIAKWEELANAYQVYEKLKIEEGLMDFGDLIVNTLKLFRQRPNVLKEYGEQFKYFLIDEFQDTNYAQNQLAVLLAGKKQNITVVGDDDQSIYRFRGAAVSNILQFKKIYPTAKVITLNKNYRTTQSILDEAYKLIQFNNPDRLEVAEKVNKRLVCQRKRAGGDVIFIHQDRVENEAESVTNAIRKLMKERGYEYRDFAVLVRANNHADPFIRSFQRHSIPYQFLGPGRLFKQAEIVDLISYLKVLYNFEDSISLYKLLTNDYFEFSLRDLIKISNYAKRKNICLYEACEKIADIFVSEDGKEKVGKLLKIIEKHLKLIKKETAGQLLYDFLVDTGLLQRLLNPDTPESEKRAGNISKFFDKLKSYEAGHEDASVFAVVDWIELLTELGESPLSADTDWNNVDAVNLLSVHSSKGLEFPVVFLVNLVTQRFPSTERKEQIPLPESLIKEVLPQGDYHVQEERRLFYVGMTRARDYLYLTAADYYGDGKREKKLSQFIFEALGDGAVSSEIKGNQGKQLSFLEYADSDIPLHPSVTTNRFHLDYISYSQIDTFRTCPLHYKMRYIVKLPEAPSAALSFGMSVHDALKHFYTRVQQGEKIGKDSLLQILDTDWKSDGYHSKSHEDKMKMKGRQYLTAYYDKHFHPQVIPVALEHNFIFPVKSTDGTDWVKLGGRIDRVDRLSDGRIEIVDYKTGANIPTQKEVDKDLQLTFYALAATTLQEFPYAKKPEEVVLSLYYFEEQLKIQTVRTAEQLSEAKEEIFKWKKQIEESDFKCTHGYFCQNCEFKMFCGSE